MDRRKLLNQYQYLRGWRDAEGRRPPLRKDSAYLAGYRDRSALREWAGMRRGEPDIIRPAS